MSPKTYFADIPRKHVRRTCRATEAVELALNALGGQGGRELRLLCALWDNWRSVMGRELAELAFPLGHKNRVLLIGAEDAMAAQELSLQTPEMLERANAFMDSAFFEQIRVTLLQGQRPLTEKRRPRPVKPPVQPLPPRPPRLGALASAFAADSPAARAYAAYLRLFA